MGVFWPDYAEPEPEVLGRLGRVLHWIALCIAGAPAIVALVMTLSDESARWSDIGLIAVVVVIWGAAWALLGRGARYILAGE